MNRSDEVADWLRARFAERPCWLPSEMLMRAKLDAIDLGFWFQHPAIRVLIDRHVSIEVWPGFFEPHWGMAREEWDV